MCQVRLYAYYNIVIIDYSVTRLGDLLDFGKLFKPFDNN